MGGPGSQRHRFPTTAVSSVLTIRPWPIRQKLIALAVWYHTPVATATRAWTWEHVSKHWQPGWCKLWRNCLMSWIPLSNLSFQDLRDTYYPHCCVKALTGTSRMVSRVGLVSKLLANSLVEDGRDPTDNNSQSLFVNGFWQMALVLVQNRWQDIIQISGGPVPANMYMSLG